MTLTNACPLGRWIAGLSSVCVLMLYILFPVPVHAQDLEDQYVPYLAVGTGVSGSLLLYNATDPHNLVLLSSQPGVGNTIRSLRFSPDNRLLGLGSDTGFVYLYGLDDPRNITLLAERQDVKEGALWVYDLDFHPGGRWMATASDDACLRLYDVSTPRNITLVDTRPGSHGSLWSLDFSPDGTLLAAGSGEGYLTLYTISDAGKLVQRTERKVGSGEVWSLGFSPDNQHLAAGLDGQLSLLGRLGTHNITLLDRQPMGSQISSVRFSPDARLLASGSTSGNLTLFNIGKDERLESLGSHVQLYNILTSLAFSANSRWLATGSDNDAYLYQVGDAGNLTVITHFDEGGEVMLSVDFSHDPARNDSVVPGEPPSSLPVTTGPSTPAINPVTGVSAAGGLKEISGVLSLLLLGAFVASSVGF